MRGESRISSTVLLLLASLFTEANGSAQLYEFGPSLDKSLDAADELYVEVSLIDPPLYLGVENSELHVSCTTYNNDNTSFSSIHIQKKTGY